MARVVIPLPLPLTGVFFFLWFFFGGLNNMLDHVWRRLNSLRG